jgi:hypothetical protein
VLAAGPALAASDDEDRGPGGLSVTIGATAPSGDVAPGLLPGTVEADPSIGLGMGLYLPVADNFAAALRLDILALNTGRIDVPGYKSGLDTHAVAVGGSVGAMYAFRNDSGVIPWVESTIGPYDTSLWLSDDSVEGDRIEAASDVNIGVMGGAGVNFQLLEGTTIGPAIRYYHIMNAFESHQAARVFYIGLELGLMYY